MTEKESIILLTKIIELVLNEIKFKVSVFSRHRDVLCHAA